MRLVGLKPLIQVVGRVFRVRPRGGGSRDEARRIADTVAEANARLRPRRAACLGRSLVTWAALRSHGYDAAFRIGGAKDGDAFRAHAWVEWDGEPLAEPEDIQATYAAFPIEPEHLGLNPHRSV